MLNFTANSYYQSLATRRLIARPKYGGARRQKREESLATRPLGRIFIFANSGFNFRTWGFFMRFKDKPEGGGGRALPARPSNPFIKNIHPSNSRSKALAPLSSLLFPLPSPRLFRFLVSLSSPPRVPVSTFLSSTLAIASAHISRVFFFPRPSCFVILHFYERV